MALAPIAEQPTVHGRLRDADDADRVAVGVVADRRQPQVDGVAGDDAGLDAARRGRAVGVRVARLGVDRTWRSPGGRRCRAVGGVLDDVLDVDGLRSVDRRRCDVAHLVADDVGLPIGGSTVSSPRISVVLGTTRPSGSPEGVVSLLRTGTATESATRTTAVSSSGIGEFCSLGSGGFWVTETVPLAVAAPLLTT